MKKSIFFFLVILNTVISYAQNRNIELKPYLGISNYSVQDQLFSPLIYSGNNIFVGFEKTKKTAKCLRFFDINYANGKLENNSLNTISHNVGNISIAFLWPVSTNNNFYLGASNNTKIAIRQFSLAKKFGAESYSGDLFSTLNINIAYQFPEKKWGSFFAKFDAPFAGLSFSRKNYDIISNPDLIVINENNISKSVLKSAEIIGISNLKLANLDINYSRNLNAKHKIIIGLISQIYRYERLNSSVISRNLSISAGYSF
jgi:hypothetical protein